MSDLRLQKKAHEVCSKLFFRVGRLCQIFAYRTKHALCVVSYFFGSLTYRHFCQIFAYRTRHTKCVVSFFFASLIYVRSSLTDQAHAVCSKLFLRVALLFQIFGFRTRETRFLVSCFFGSLSYVRSSITEQGTRRV